MPVTLFIIGITVLVSWYCFEHESARYRLLLYPVVMRHPKEAYRLLSSGFIHADTMHLIFNMISLYFFGISLEREIGAEHFIMLYLSGIIVANLPSFYRHMHNANFASLGASGGVAAVIFACIYFNPWDKIYFFFNENLGIPSIIFAAGYLVYSAFMSRQAKQTVNHTAHFWGSVYGLLYMIILDPTHGAKFISRILQVNF